eukprot:4180494-Pyramimonas_sp.AAC.1
MRQLGAVLVLAALAPPVGLAVWRAVMSRRGSWAWGATSIGGVGVGLGRRRLFWGAFISARSHLQVTFAGHICMSHISTSHEADGRV